MRDPVETVRFTESSSFLSPKETETPERLTRGIDACQGDWLKKITTGDMPVCVTSRPSTLSFASEVKRSPPEAAL
jgi:predicted nucleic acid binding AN1-type Zn finger protein